MILYPLLAAAAICMLSLSGAIFYFFKPSTLQKALPYLIALSIGILLSNSFLHLIPEAIEATGSVHYVSFLTLAGILFFFLIEKSIHRHGRDAGSKEAPYQLSPAGVKPLGKLNLLGDFFHNFTDGALIAGSFAVSPQLGVVTTIAIAAHEIPQEISDTGTLVYSGYSLKRSILFNFVGSFSCMLGVVVVLLLGQAIPLPIEYILPITAGGFIYIAVCDMMPELQGIFSLRAQVGQGIAMIVGFLIILGTGAIAHG